MLPCRPEKARAVSPRSPLGKSAEPASPADDGSSAAVDPILRIVLTGFMGAGKSTLGALVAARLGWRLVDIDHLLVASHAAPIATLFDRLGEADFRKLEEQAIAEQLTLDHTVLALGGGALESAATRERLLASPGTHVVFLETPLDIALTRCAQQQDGAVRPLLRDPAAVQARFEQRLEHYRIAHETLSTAACTPQLLARQLLASLAPRLDRTGLHSE